jgi:hypothetical protein
LREDRVDHREHHLPLAQEVHLAALPGRF